MRRILLPLILLPAIGAVVVLTVLYNKGDRNANREVPVGTTPDAAPAAVANGISTARPATPTPVDEFPALSDLERVMSRTDRSRARYCAELVCQQMENVLANPKHTRALLDLIRTRGVDSENPEDRDILLPMLRVLEHPEATQMVEAEYYRARTEEERMMLLDAMSRPYHNPVLAGQLAVDRALYAESAEHRYHAFDLIVKHAGDRAVVLRTAVDVYAGTTRPDQAEQALEAIDSIAYQEEGAQKWIRGKLKGPRVEELDRLTSSIIGWGTPNDAAQLEALANEFPAFGDQLRERAEGIRMRMREAERAKRGPDVPPARGEQPRPRPHGQGEPPK